MSIKRIVFVIICLCFSFSLTAKAHTNSQIGTLAQYYCGEGGYDGWYIGGESVRWGIDESEHTHYNSYVTYKFANGSFNDAQISVIEAGIGLWSNEYSFTRVFSGTSTGVINSYYSYGNPTVAFFDSNGTDSNGHNTSWTISINLAYGVSSSTAAHEIGHAIGLIDLFSTTNTGQLMYHTESRSATAPSSYDKWGAKVILGIHSTHNWGYRYYGNLPSGSRHIKYCTQCNGNSLTIEYCTYNNLGICTKCGSSNSVQPW